MKKCMERLEALQELGGIRKDVTLLAISGVATGPATPTMPLLPSTMCMRKTIKLNMTFSMTLNFIAIVLAMTGTRSPVVGALVHNAGSVLVITNSAFLLNFVQKRRDLF